MTTKTLSRTKIFKRPKGWPFAIMIGWTLTLKILWFFSTLSNPQQDSLNQSKSTNQTTARKRCKSRKCLVLREFGTIMRNNSFNKKKRRRKRTQGSHGSNCSRRMTHRRWTEVDWELMKSKDLSTFTLWSNVITKRQLMKFISNVMAISLSIQIFSLTWGLFLMISCLIRVCSKSNVMKCQLRVRSKTLSIEPWVTVRLNSLGKILNFPCLQV